ncbi:hypothetical protein HDU98_007714, partial [Podochytrium sp. JEL0797]
NTIGTILSSAGVIDDTPSGSQTAVKMSVHYFGGNNATGGGGNSAARGESNLNSMAGVNMSLDEEDGEDDDVAESSVAQGGAVGFGLTGSTGLGAGSNEFVEAVEVQVG